MGYGTSDWETNTRPTTGLRLHQLTFISVVQDFSELLSFITVFFKDKKYGDLAYPHFQSPYVTIDAVSAEHHASSFCHRPTTDRV